MKRLIFIGILAAASVFEAELEFQKPLINKGTLILEKDNPSGLPENADELRVPVRFLW